MTTQLTISQPSIERVQIHKLVDIILVMSSIAAIPGLLISWYPISVVLSYLIQGSSRSGWAPAFLLASVLYVGWWLYWTYGLELNGRNYLGKVTWLVSIVFNVSPVYWLIFYVLPELGNPSVCFYLVILWILWLFVMAMLSARVWMLRLKERV